jgi:hypothetical protein
LQRSDWMEPAPNFGRPLRSACSPAPAVVLSAFNRRVADEPSLTITSAATREFVHPMEDRLLTLRFPRTSCFACLLNAAAIWLFPHRSRNCRNSPGFNPGPTTAGFRWRGLKRPRLPVLPRQSFWKVSYHVPGRRLTPGFILEIFPFHRFTALSWPTWRVRASARRGGCGFRGIRLPHTLSSFPDFNRSFTREE